MSEKDLLQFSVDALYLVLVLSLPAILAAAVVGTLVSLFQALTQIQEQTLSFVLKLIAVVVTLLVTGQWLGTELMQLGTNVFASISQV